VRMQRQGGFVVTIPPKKGDKVLLRPQMRSSEKWHEEEIYETVDKRSQSLADYEAYLDGGESLQKPISGFNSDSMELRSEDGNTAIEVGDGFVEIRVGGSSIRIDGSSIKLLSDQIDLN